MSTPAHSESALTIEQLSAYYGLQQVLFDISLELKQGSAIAVVGPNGVGKTSLLRAVTKSFGININGHVSVDGTSIGDRKAYEIAQLGVAFVPSDRRIFPLTVCDNLRMAARKHARRSDIPSLLDEFNYFPVLRDRLGQRGDTLSGGEQQALAIVRAILSRPRYLLLDEPTEGLSPRAVEAVVAGLAEMKRDLRIGLLLVDRNAKAIGELCSDVFVMARGRIASRTTSSEFVTDLELRKRALMTGTHG